MEILQPYRTVPGVSVLRKKRRFRRRDLPLSFFWLPHQAMDVLSNARLLPTNAKLVPSKVYFCWRSTRQVFSSRYFSSSVRFLFFLKLNLSPTVLRTIHIWPQEASHLFVGAYFLFFFPVGFLSSLAPRFPPLLLPLPLLSFSSLPTLSLPVLSLHTSPLGFPQV